MTDDDDGFDDFGAFRGLMYCAGSFFVGLLAIVLVYINC